MSQQRPRHFKICRCIHILKGTPCGIDGNQIRFGDISTKRDDRNTISWIISCRLWIISSTTGRHRLPYNACIGCNRAASFAITISAVALRLVNWVMTAGSRKGMSHATTKMKGVVACTSPVYNPPRLPHSGTRSRTTLAPTSSEGLSCAMTPVPPERFSEAQPVLSQVFCSPTTRYRLSSPILRLLPPARRMPVTSISIIPSMQRAKKKEGVGYPTPS